MTSTFSTTSTILWLWPGNWHGSDTLQVVKISYPPPPAASPAAGSSSAAAGAGTGAGAGAGAGAGGGGGQQIEQELKQTGQAEVYGIYFDFASDKIKPESEPVLREIADALNHNPTWKLRVEGHTDNIGGDEYNLDLSQRRAEAVKSALVTRYHIGARNASRLRALALPVPKNPMTHSPVAPATGAWNWCESSTWVSSFRFLASVEPEDCRKSHKWYESQRFVSSTHMGNAGTSGTYEHTSKDFQNWRRS